MSRRASLIRFLPILVIGLVLDRLTKAWAVEALPALRPAPEAGPIRLTLVHNTGAAFGIGAGHQGVFAAFALVVLAAIFAWLLLSKEGHGRLEVLSLGLIAVGAVGNCIDRVAQSYVVDFIEFTFIDFPVFNIADICVTAGVVLFVVSVLLSMPGKKPEGSVK